MKPTFDHRIAVNLPRNRFCRNTVKKLDKIMTRDKRTKNYYTGLCSRNLCFQFETAEKKDEFRTFMQGFIDNIGINGVI